MQVKIAPYDNQAINANGPLFTTNCTLNGYHGGRLGGCDHYMKKSVKSIVTYYTNRMIREGVVGKFEIEIDLVEGICSRKVVKSFRIKFTVK